MVQNCRVPGCKNRKTRGADGSSFHVFPKDETLQREWLQALNLRPQRLSWNKDLRVCSLHFADEDFVFRGNKKKLKKRAIPKVPKFLEQYKENWNPAIEKGGKMVEENTCEDISSRYTLLETKAKILGEENILLRASLAEQKCINESKELEIAALKREVDYLNSENNRLRKIPSNSTFSFHKFENNDKKILYYTGFQNFQIMSEVYNFLLPTDNVDDLDIHRTLSEKEKPHSFFLPPKDQFFLTMVRLRRGFNIETLGDLFDISTATAGKLFLCWINVMYIRLGGLNIWPHRNVLIGNAPEQFQRDYKKVVGSIDCTEFVIQTPSSLIKQSQCYSHYKSSTTLKSLLMTDPNGAIIYMSQLFTGSASDKKIIIDSGFIEILRNKVANNELCRGDTILADKGFNISSLLDDVQMNINIPTFRVTGTQFTVAEVQWIREIACERIHVERAIGRLKQYQILTKKIPIGMLGSIEQIYTICCILCNFRNKLR